MTRANPHIADQAALVGLTGLRKWATYASVATAIILIAIKLAAFLFTDSVALLASLADSTIDAFASIIMLIGVHHAARPADREHRYGHGKFESLASLAQAMFIVGSAIFLIYEALGRFVTPREVQNIAIGVGVIGVSIVLTAMLIGFQQYVIRQTGSIAIAADNLHYRADLLMNLAVLAALGLSRYTAWPYFDPLFALVIAVILLRGSWQIGTRAIDILMDRELPESERQKIFDIVNDQPQVCGMHDLRTRTTGLQVFIEFHLEIEGRLNVYQAHSITEHIESLLYEAFPEAEVIIHQEPCGIDDDRLDHRLEDGHDRTGVAAD